MFYHDHSVEDVRVNWTPLSWRMKYSPVVFVVITGHGCHISPPASSWIFWHMHRLMSGYTLMWVILTCTYITPLLSGNMLIFCPPYDYLWCSWVPWVLCWLRWFWYSSWVSLDLWDHLSGHAAMSSLTWAYIDTTLSGFLSMQFMSFCFHLRCLRFCTIGS